MKTQTLSNTHNEFLTGLLRTELSSKAQCNQWIGKVPEIDADIIVLSGDIDVGVKGDE